MIDPVIQSTSTSLLTKDTPRDIIRGEPCGGSLKIVAEGMLGFLGFHADETSTHLCVWIPPKKNDTKNTARIEKQITKRTNKRKKQTNNQPTKQTKETNKQTKQTRPHLLSRFLFLRREKLWRDARPRPEWWILSLQKNRRIEANGWGYLLLLTTWDEKNLVNNGISNCRSLNWLNLAGFLVAINSSMIYYLSKSWILLLFLKLFG